MMKRLIAPIASLVLIPLLVGQVMDKPSPVPQKRRAGAARIASRSTPAYEASSSKAPASDLPVSSFEDTKETGKASYFTAAPEGTLTASGETVTSDDFVAAHPTYPFGSRVLVTNLANGKTVQVRIVDRFRKGSGRVINVSESAAIQLDFIQNGSAEVSVQLAK